MIIPLIKYIFEKTDNLWSIKDQGYILPSEDDIEKALDKAAEVLYDSPVGDRLSMGGLLIEKRPNGHDVYVHVGNYR